MIISYLLTHCVFYARVWILKNSFVERFHVEKTKSTMVVQPVLVLAIHCVIVMSLVHTRFACPLWAVADACGVVVICMLFVWAPCMLSMVSQLVVQYVSSPCLQTLSLSPLYSLIFPFLFVVHAIVLPFPLCWFLLLHTRGLPQILICFQNYRVFFISIHLVSPLTFISLPLLLAPSSIPMILALASTSKNPLPNPYVSHSKAIVSQQITPNFIFVICTRNQ